MKRQLERFNGDLRLPISSIGNICLLPEDYNRRKGEKTIYQYKDEELSIEEIENKYSFTTEKDLKWIEDMEMSKEELQFKYNKLINDRFERIKEKLVNILY